MNAERLKIGDQVVVRSVPRFAARVVKRGDYARVAEVLKDGKKVQYRFRFDGYNNLGRKSRTPIQLPRGMFERATVSIPQYGKGGLVPKRQKKERAPKGTVSIRIRRHPRTALGLLAECRGLMETLVDKLSVLERLSAESLAPLPGLDDGTKKAAIIISKEQMAEAERPASCS